MRILFIEDDEQLGEVTHRALMTQGWVVDWLRSAANLTSILRQEAFDVLLLDIGLPGIDGLAALHCLRSAGIKTPVLMLTARDQVEDRVRGLSAGADDYLVKPFALAELLARVNALVRRTAAFVTNEMTLGNLTMDLSAKRVFVANTSIELLPREWAVLHYLLRNIGRVVSKEQIIDAIFGWDNPPSANAAEVYVSRLRAKLSAAEISIQTVRGFGYMLTNPADRA
ncbi:MAG TPA: response regulator transcription factor [Halothiobacillus sp.]|nr:response regulator transcription factor [Halothiobacillus sp.]